MNQRFQTNNPSLHLEPTVVETQWPSKPSTDTSVPGEKFNDETVIHSSWTHEWSPPGMSGPGLSKSVAVVIKIERLQPCDEKTQMQSCSWYKTRIFYTF